ncbi:glycerate kinase [Endozoicomonadaceae bacterium StTr2]
MKIAIVPDSFKESLTSAQVTDAIETGFKQILPDIDYIKIPVADGGEGTLQSLVDATNGLLIEKTVAGPLGQPVQASFGILGDGKTAVIEMAQASGLELLSPELRNPLITTTYGTGELIRHALDQGINKLIIGLGGSATNDGGAGMLQALGARLLDSEETELPYGGDALSRLATIDISNLDQRLVSVECVTACDVDNPLTGPNGASAIFGPQKGADTEMVQKLDNSLSHFAEITRKQLGIDINSISGAGAAGGTGAALAGFINAKLQPGIDIVMDAVDLKNQIKGASLVITGEGRIDGQTAQGKTPVGVARIAKAQNIPVIALAGSVGKGVEAVYSQGIDAVFPVIHGAVELSEAFEMAAENLERAARNLAAVLQLSIK